MKKFSLFKDIEKDLLNPLKEKRVMKLNKILASKYVITILAVLLGIVLFWSTNFFFNILTNTGNIIANISEVREYIRASKGFYINTNYPLFYMIDIIFIVIVEIIFIYNFRESYKDLNVQQKGSERWATLDEIKSQYRSVAEKKEPIKGNGGIPICRYKDQIFIDDSPVNTLIVGITRSGKGETIFYPTIDIFSRAENQPSIIALDPKLDEYPTCYNALTSRGYDCYLFNLNDPLKGMGYNPVTLAVEEYKAGRIAEAELVLQSYCYNTFHNKASLNTKEPFFPDGSTNILFCLIWAQMVDNLAADKKINEYRKKQWKRKQDAFENLTDSQKNDVLQKIQSIKEKIMDEINSNPLKNKKELQKQVDEKLQEYLLNFKYIPSKIKYILTTENEKKCNVFSALKSFLSLMGVTVPDGKKVLTGLDIYFGARPKDDIARLRYAPITSASPNQKGNLFQYMIQQIQQYLLENIAKFTSHNTLKISDIGYGEKPVAVFLTIPDYDESLHVLATTFIDQVYFALSKKAARSQTKRCDRDVLFYLEEAGNIPEIKYLKAGTTMGLSRGFKFVLSVQSYTQLEEIYGEKTARTIISNCGNHIYIKCNDVHLAKEFSDLIGNETVTNVSRMGGKLSWNKTFTETYEAKPLLNENELMDIEEEDCVIKRTMRRRDLQGNKIREYPIYNHGETAFKMRYKYLEDDFPSDVNIDDLPTGNNSDINLDEYTVDLTEFFNSVLNQNLTSESVMNSQSGNTTTEEFISEQKKTIKEEKTHLDDLRQSAAMLSTLPNGNIILKMLQNMISLDQNDLTVSEAVCELELAEAAFLITPENKENIISLLKESELSL